MHKQPKELNYYYTPQQIKPKLVHNSRTKQPDGNLIDKGLFLKYKNEKEKKRINKCLQTRSSSFPIDYKGLRLPR